MPSNDDDGFFLNATFGGNPELVMYFLERIPPVFLEVLSKARLVALGCHNPVTPQIMHALMSFFPHAVSLEVIGCDDMLHALDPVIEDVVFTKMSHSPESKAQNKTSSVPLQTTSSALRAHMPISEFKPKNSHSIQTGPTSSSLVARQKLPAPSLALKVRGRGVTLLSQTLLVTSSKTKSLCKGNLPSS